jgi:hypothetical protein
MSGACVIASIVVCRRGGTDKAQWCHAAPKVIESQSARVTLNDSKWRGTPKVVILVRICSHKYTLCHTKVVGKCFSVSGCTA